MATGLLTAAVAIASASVSVAAAPLPAGPASAPVPVIVRGAPGSLAAVDRDITEAGGRVAEQIPLITASAPRFRPRLSGAWAPNRASWR